MPNLLAILYNSIKTILVSNNSGLVNSVMKGKIEAIPIVSNKAITIINNNSKYDFFLSDGVRSSKIFFKIYKNKNKKLKTIAIYRYF